MPVTRSRDQREQLGRTEARQHHMPAAGERVGEDAPAGGQMPERPDMELDRWRIEPRDDQGVQRVHDEIGVAQHHALGPPRCAAGIEDRRQIPAPAQGILGRLDAGDERFIGQRLRRGTLRGGDARPQARDLLEKPWRPLRQSRIEDEGHRLCITELAQDLRLAQSRIERHEDPAAPAGAVIDLDAAVAVLGQRRHPVAGRHSEPAESARKPRHAIRQLAPAKMANAAGHRDRASPEAAGTLQALGEMHGSDLPVHALR